MNFRKRPSISNYMDIKDDDKARALYLHDRDIYREQQKELEKLEEQELGMYYDYLEVIGAFNYEEVIRSNRVDKRL